MTYNGNYPPLSRFFVAPDASESERQPKRICILTQDIFGPVRNAGIGTAYKHAAEFCAGQGHDVTIVYTQGQKSTNRNIKYWIDYYADRKVRFVPAVPLGYDEEGLPAINAWSLAGYLTLMREDPFDIVHTSECGASGYYPMLAKRFFGRFPNTAFCVKTSSPNLWSREGNWENLPVNTGPLTSKMERFCVENADLVIAPSQHMLNWMVDHGYILPRHVCVHPNIAPSTSLAPAGAAGADAAPVLPNEICFFGRLEPRKGLNLFAEAVKLCAEELRSRNVRITFLGKSVSRFDFEAFKDDLLRATGLDIWIITNLDSAEVNDYLRQPGRVAVIPSLLDNSPFTVYECLINRIPFIASSVGGIPELIAASDRDRLLFSPRPAKLADKLRTLVTTPLQPGSLSFDPVESQADWARFHAAPSPEIYPRSIAADVELADAPEHEQIGIGVDGLDIDQVTAVVSRSSAQYYVLLARSVQIPPEKLSEVLIAMRTNGVMAVTMPMSFVDPSEFRQLVPVWATNGEEIFDTDYIAPGNLILERSAMSEVLRALREVGVIQDTFLQEIALIAAQKYTLVPWIDATADRQSKGPKMLAMKVAERNRLLYHFVKGIDPELGNRMRVYAELRQSLKKATAVKESLEYIRSYVTFIRNHMRIVRSE